MKQLTLLILVTLCCSFTAMSQKPIPSVTVKTLGGQVFDLKEYTSDDSKTYIIDFWATWCSPCKKELDAIAVHYEDWQKDYNVELIAITIDNQRALPKVSGLVETKGWKYTIFTGNEVAMQKAFDFQTIPQTLVAKAGKIIHEHNGYTPGDEVELEKIVAKASAGE